MIHDDEICLLVCGPELAKALIENDEDIADTLIVTRMMQGNNAVLVQEQDFIDWLYEKGEYADRI